MILSKLQQLTDQLENKVMICPMCSYPTLEQPLQWEQHNNTHIYVCPICPFIGFEFIDITNVDDLKDYLK